MEGETRTRVEGGVMTTLRRVTTALLAAVTLAQGGVQAASTTDYSDQWWVEKESGWGASVLQQADVLFIDLFVYGADGKPTWFTAAAYYQSGSPAGHQVFAGDLNLTTGSYYGAPWSASALAYRKVGTLTFDATGVGEAVLTYTVDGTPTRKDVTRQPWRYENLSGSYYGGWGGEQVSCTLASDNGAFEATGTIEITHGADNVVTLRLVSPATGDDLTLTGRYSQTGHMGQIAATVDGPPVTASLGFFEIERTNSGFTGRFAGSIQSSTGTCQIANGRVAGVRR